MTVLWNVPILLGELVPDHGRQSGVSTISCFHYSSLQNMGKSEISDHLGFY